MLFNRFYFLLLLQFCLISSSEISKTCICRHIQSQKDCKNSGVCIWENEYCVLGSGKTYNSKIKNQNPCKNYAQEDCRELEQCGFYYGLCIDFVDCNIFDKDNCQESSYKCVSDGQKCVQMQECSDYKTENACSNKNQYGKYCVWIWGTEKKCTDVTMCKLLPSYLNNHTMCKSGFDGCTISEKGYGCTEQMESCAQYVNNFQCFESKSRKDNCFWDSKNNKCVEKVCENLPFTEDYECKSNLSQCTTNGVHCVLRRQCSDVQNKVGCVTDILGQKCDYHKNQCKIKSCNTAPESLTNYQQCQDYDNLLDCVTSENKGCKIRPATCDGYVYEMDCYSLEQQDCVWYKKKCEQRQCYHAQAHYTHKDCQGYGNCMGKLNGGCQQTPNLCEEILQDQFCEFTYNKERCIWVKGVCESLECKKLKLPTYNNHKACQKESSYCTFNLNSLGCTEYTCENVLEIEDCTIDSNGQICTQNQGCIEKKCMTAHPTLDTNSKCEGWMPKCTVNVQVLSNQKILIGCVDKRSICELAVQEQCQSTLSGHMCKWNGSSQKCINQLCQDASPSLYLTNEDCKQFKVLSGPCIIGPSGVGCYQWPTNCTEMKSQQQCQLNIQNGTKCFWTGTYCKQQECSDAPKLYYTNNVQCNNWSSNCIFDHSLGGCIDRINQVACSSSPNVVMYNNHVECYARNQNCTVVSNFTAEGCERKKETCYEYIKRRNCKTTLSGYLCYWDDKENKCMNEDEDNNGVVDCHKRLNGELTHQDCEDFMPKCTLNQITLSCRQLSDYCNYKYQQQCIINSYQQPCKWNDLKQICEDVVCADNSTSQTESECLMFRQNNECQLKINSEGTYGPGCENRPKSCQEITDPLICKLTLTTQNEKCYFHSSFCMVILSKYCEQITESQSNEFCQLYNPNCVLQSSGQGCYSIYECGDLTSSVCNNAIMRSNSRCSFLQGCFRNIRCSDKINAENCFRKTFFGQQCELTRDCLHCQDICTLVQKYIFESLTPLDTTFDGLNQCNDISTSLIYNTECHCCKLIVSCDFAPQSLCNQSTDYFGNQCQYNQQSNVCGYRECEQLTSDQGISELICYQWKSECVLGATSCISYNNDCTKIGLIQQCYSYQCYWQDGKCVSYVNCGLNTTAVTNRECLLSNSTFCRFNYTKGLGCAFISCDQIKNEAICTVISHLN